MEATGMKNTSSTRIRGSLRRVTRSILQPATLPVSRDAVKHTVSTDDDPRGPRGTRVRYERQEDYDKRCERWSKEDEKLWAKIMRGYCGAARQTALRAPRSAQALLDLIQQEHGGNLMDICD